VLRSLCGDDSPRSRISFSPAAWRADGRDEERAWLKATVGDLTMRLALSREAIQRLGGGIPFGRLESDALSDATKLSRASGWRSRPG